MHVLVNTRDGDRVPSLWWRSLLLASVLAAPGPLTPQHLDSQAAQTIPINHGPIAPTSPLGYLETEDAIYVGILDPEQFAQALAAGTYVLSYHNRLSTGLVPLQRKRHVVVLRADAVAN